MVSFNYTDPIDQSQGHVTFSPSSSMVAATMGSRVTLRDLPSMEVRHLYMCIDKVDRIEFSPDSKYVMCAIISRNAIQVFSVLDAEWKCRINEGVAGLVSARWAPDSRHILVESDFGIQLSVWSLSEVSCQVISYPKQGCANVLSFTADGKFMAVAHRLELHDHIGVYSTSPWSEMCKFKCSSEANNDLSSVQWTPSGSHIIAADSHLQYKLAVYTPSGELVTVYEAYDSALGLRQAVFHEPVAPVKEICPLLALGSYDGCVRLLSTSFWKPTFVLPCKHPREMEGGIDNDAVTTVESIRDDNEDDSLATNSNPNKRTLGQSYSKKQLKTLPAVNGPTGSKVSSKANSSKLPKMGVSYIGFSPDGRLVAVRDEAHPRCLWVWSTFDAKLQDLVVQLDSITCARWQPTTSAGGKPLLAYCCGSARVYLWSGGHASWVDLPSHYELKVLAVRWSADGQRLIALSRDLYVVCSITDDAAGASIHVENAAATQSVFRAAQA